jgi:hypothetical protein
MVEEIKSAFEGVKTEVNGAIETLKADNAVAVDGLKTELEELKSQISVVKDAADKLEAKNNRKTMNENQAKGFNASLAEAIEKNADSIAKLGRGEQKRSGFILDTKAVGNMTEAVNLTGGFMKVASGILTGFKNFNSDTSTSNLRLLNISIDKFLWT